ncbi:MAG: transcriptional regulator [Synergistaceae bacterium]|nr:transcriptional regulator [Synergistota bacterium]NLM71229.1 transcriptional regulator [Synergistaceae bacterium]
MILREIASLIRAEVLTGEELLDTLDIECAYGADLMSDVLAFARPGSLLLTGLTNIQIVRTAQMLDLPSVVFVRGKKPQEPALKLATQIKMPLMLCQMSMFESCGILFQKGILPCHIPNRGV